MRNYTAEEIETALQEISVMDHYTMCSIWRFGARDAYEEIYLRSDLPTGKAFTDRLFQNLGGFTPDISKSLGWER